MKSHPILASIVAGIALASGAHAQQQQQAVQQHQAAQQQQMDLFRKGYTVK
ncbi:MAG TPA: hypothetical protein PL152_04100 [Steroidobacteraceae bacterium]|nr:hypothetical protein [Steroidobacteraceae bacterium]HQR48492.1 hypothetical protein [Steroidobacteraceae bacterium]